MRAAVQYTPDCPHRDEAARRLRAALDALGHNQTTIDLVPVDTDAGAVALGFAGSPTLTLDGADLFPAGTAPGALTCRVYRTRAGLAGVPDHEDLVEALRHRIER